MCNILHLKQDNVKYMTHYQKKEKLLWDSEGFKGFEENRLDSHGFGKSILSFVNFFENPITWILSTPPVPSPLCQPPRAPLYMRELLFVSPAGPASYLSRDRVGPVGYLSRDRVGPPGIFCQGPVGPHKKGRGPSH